MSLWIFSISKLLANLSIGVQYEVKLLTLCFEVVCLAQEIDWGM